MKHLKRFNENAEDDLDIEYIKHCFADLSDDTECGLEYETHEDHINGWSAELTKKYGQYVSISFNIPRITKGRSIEKMVENSERIALVVKSLDIAVKRLKDEYPNYKINIDYEEDEDRPNDYFLINITK
jgi:hypothetical protein